MYGQIYFSPLYQGLIDSVECIREEKSNRPSFKTSKFKVLSSFLGLGYKEFSSRCNWALASGLWDWFFKIIKQKFLKAYDNYLVNKKKGK